MSIFKSIKAIKSSKNLVIIINLAISANLLYQAYNLLEESI